MTAVTVTGGIVDAGWQSLVPVDVTVKWVPSGAWISGGVLIAGRPAVATMTGSTRFSVVVEETDPLGPAASYDVKAEWRDPEGNFTSITLWERVRVPVGGGDISTFPGVPLRVDTVRTLTPPDTDPGSAYRGWWLHPTTSVLYVRAGDAVGYVDVPIASLKGADGAPGAPGAVIWDPELEDLTPAVTAGAWDTRLAPGYVQGEIPSGMSWPAQWAISPSITVDRAGNVTGSCGYTAEQFFGFFSRALSNPSTTYYVTDSGSDAADGLTEATAFRTPRRAIRAVNTAAPANGAKVLVKYSSNPDAYGSGNGFFALGGTTPEGNTSPTSDIAWVVYGRPVDSFGSLRRAPIGPWVAVGTPAKDGTYTNTYSFTTATAAIPVTRVIDTAFRDAVGLHRDLVRVGTAALCDSTPGSFFYDTANTKLYVRRHDNLAVTSDTIKAFVHKTGFFGQHQVSQYFEGFEFLGGRSGVSVSVITASQSSHDAIITNDCAMRYVGSDVDTDVNGFTINNFHGVGARFNTVADRNWKDGFNYHKGAGGSTVFSLGVNSTATGNGGPGATSANGLTLHEDLQGVEIGGSAVLNQGANVHNIDTSKMYLLGYLSADDRGDVAQGGSIVPTQIRAGGSAVIYVDHCVWAGSGTGVMGLAASGSASIRVRNNPANPMANSGPVTAY